MARKGRTEEMGALSRGQTFYFEPGTLTIVSDKRHPLYDPRVELPVSEAMVQSIMAHGVIEPVVVRKNGLSKAGKPIVEVIDGRQRVRATAEANKRLRKNGQEPIRVPTVFRRSDESDAESCAIAANEIRFSDDPVTRASKLSRYLERGHSEQEAAAAFGLERRHVRELLKIAASSTAVKAALRKGEIGVGVAKKLAEMPDTAQRKALDDMKTKGVSRGAEAHAIADTALRRRAVPVAPKCRPARQVQQLIDRISSGDGDNQSDVTLASVLPSTSMRSGVMLALRWVLRKDEDTCLDDLLPSAKDVASKEPPASP